MAGFGRGWCVRLGAVGGCVAAGLVIAPAASAAIVAASYGTGSYTFRVPAGVTSLDVIAVGAAGGGIGGGMGELVEDSAVPVSPGEALTVVVGAPGVCGTVSAGGTGGFGGGADAGDVAGANTDFADGGGGGGASGVFVGPYPLVIAGAEVAVAAAGQPGATPVAA